MKRSHIAQAHSTNYHQQTNGLVEWQNRTLVKMQRVYCLSYLTIATSIYRKWREHTTALNTQHSTAGISPFMMLTDRERAMPLTFFYPENEGQKTLPQTYVTEAIKRQQDLNELFRRNTAQGQMRQRKKYD